MRLLYYTSFSITKTTSYIFLLKTLKLVTHNIATRDYHNIDKSESSKEQVLRHQKTLLSVLVLCVELN